MGDGEVVLFLVGEDRESRLLLMCRDVGEEQMSCAIWVKSRDCRGVVMG